MKEDWCEEALLLICSSAMPLAKRSQCDNFEMSPVRHIVLSEPWIPTCLQDLLFTHLKFSESIALGHSILPNILPVRESSGWRRVRGTGSSSYMEWKMRRKERREMGKLVRDRWEWREKRAKESDVKGGEDNHLQSRKAWLCLCCGLLASTDTETCFTIEDKLVNKTPTTCGQSINLKCKKHVVWSFPVIPVALLRFWSFHSLALFFFPTYVPEPMLQSGFCIPFQNCSTVILAVLWKPHEELSGQDTDYYRYWGTSSLSSVALRTRLSGCEAQGEKRTFCKDI